MEISVSTQNRYQLIDITDQVEKALAKEKVKDGLCLVFAPHSTAAILLTENESGLKNDWLKILKKLVKKNRLVKVILIPKKESKGASL